MSHRKTMGIVTFRLNIKWTQLQIIVINIIIKGSLTVIDVDVAMVL